MAGSPMRGEEAARLAKRSAKALPANGAPRGEAVVGSGGGVNHPPKKPSTGLRGLLTRRKREDSRLVSGGMGQATPRHKGGGRGCGLAPCCVVGQQAGGLPSLVGRLYKHGASVNPTIAVCVLFDRLLVAMMPMPMVAIDPGLHQRDCSNARSTQMLE